MMDCKKALVEAGGDMEKAVAWLREKGLAKAAKKAGRATSEGLVGAYIAEDNSVAALVEVKCETDFVAKNDKFLEFVAKLTKQVAETEPPENDLTKAPYHFDGGPTAHDGITSLIAVLGENMTLGRYARFARETEGGYGTYVHANGKIGVLVEFTCPAAAVAAPEFAAMAKDVAMQIAAANPICVRQDEVPAELMEKEKEIYKKQAVAEGKPEAIAEKIVMGRIGKFYKEVCLLDQPFIKDDKKSISQLLKETGKALGVEIGIARFSRLALGEDEQE